MPHDQDDSDVCDWYDDFDNEVQDTGPPPDDEPVWTPPQFGLGSILGVIALVAVICSLSAAAGTDAESRLGGIVALSIVGSLLFMSGLLVSGLVRLVQCGEAEEPRAEDKAEPPAVGS